MYIPWLVVEFLYGVVTTLSQLGWREICGQMTLPASNPFHHGLIQRQPDDVPLHLLLMQQALV